MSDILIRDMEMPKHCGECGIKWCERWKKLIVAGMSIAKSRPTDCPLIELPPHGRLIDADKITEHKYTTIPSHRKEYADGKPKSDDEIIAFKFGWNYAIDAIAENAPTIIPASDKDINVLGKEEGEDG